MPAGFHRHLVGNTLINVFRSDIAEIRSGWQSVLSFALSALFAFSALTLLVGWQEGRASGLQKTEWWGAGMVICLEQGADLHMA